MRKIVTVACAVIIMSFSSIANAGPAFLTLDVPGGGIEGIIIDNSPSGTVSGGGGFTSTSGDISGTTGIVLFAGPIGPFTVASLTGVTTPIITIGRVDMTNVTIGGMGTILLGFTDTGHSFPFGINSFITSIGGTTDGVVSYEGGLDPGDGEMVLTHSTGVKTPTLGLGGAFSDATLVSFGPAVSAGSLFSLTHFVRITHTSSDDITSFNILTDSVVPEPSTLALSGLAMLCGAVGRVTRRQRNKKAAATTVS